MKELQKVCLSIAGLDPSGGAGILADVRAFAAFGCFPAAAVTSLTYQNTQGVFGSENQSGEVVERQIMPILDDYSLGAVKTGMLPSAEVIEAVARVLRSIPDVPLVVDPVVRSTSGFDLIDDAALRSLTRRLFPMTAVVTPNLAEAERIAGIAIEADDDLDRGAEVMHELGARCVLIKGGHRIPGSDPAIAVDHLFISGVRHEIMGEYIETTSTHGTGCILSSAIAANLALGKELIEAVTVAKAFVNEAIRTAPGLGKGNGPINIRAI